MIPQYHSWMHGHLFIQLSSQFTDTAMPNSCVNRTCLNWNTTVQVNLKNSLWNGEDQLLLNLFTLLLGPEIQNFFRQLWNIIWETFKVHIFWKGHKILRNLHLIFDLCRESKSKVKILQNFVAFSEYMNFTYNNFIAQIIFTTSYLEKGHSSSWNQLENQKKDFGLGNFLFHI